MYLASQVSWQFVPRKSLSGGCCAFCDLVSVLTNPALLFMDLRPIRKQTATHVAQRSPQLTLELFTPIRTS